MRSEKGRVEREEEEEEGREEERLGERPGNGGNLNRVKERDGAIAGRGQPLSAGGV